MNNKHVCVIGASNLDLYVNIKSDLIEDVSLCGNISFAAGGVGRNIAANLASLEISNHFISIFSNDTYGQILLSSLDNEFICTKDSILNANTCSAYCDLLTISNHFGINDMESLTKLTPYFFRQKKEQLEKMDYIIFDLNIPYESINYLLNNIKTKWICDATSVIKCSNLGKNLSKLYILKANYAEALQIANLKSECKIETLIDELLYQGIKNLYITLGAEGAIFASNDQKIYMKHKFPIRKYSTVGSGDVFLAAILHGILLNYDTYKILSYAIKLSYSFIKEKAHQLNEHTIQSAAQITNQDIITFLWCKTGKKWFEYSQTELEECIF